VWVGDYGRHEREVCDMTTGALMGSTRQGAIGAQAEADARGIAAL